MLVIILCIPVGKATDWNKEKSVNIRGHEGSDTSSGYRKFCWYPWAARYKNYLLCCSHIYI